MINFVPPRQSLNLSADRYPDMQQKTISNYSLDVDTQGLLLHYAPSFFIIMTDNSVIDVFRIVKIVEQLCQSLDKIIKIKIKGKTKNIYM